MLPAKHSAGQKSGAVPDPAGGFSKRPVEISTANSNVKAMIEQTRRYSAIIFWYAIFAGNYSGGYDAFRICTSTDRLDGWTGRAGHGRKARGRFGFRQSLGS